MVALETTAARAEAAPRAGARRARSRWLLATTAVLALGSLLPLAVAPGIGHLSAAVLSLMLASGAAAAGLALGSARAAFWASLGVMLVLDLGRLPPRPGPGYDEPQALWQTEQTINVSLNTQGEAPTHLAVFAEPVFEGDQAPFGLAATVNGRTQAWQCPFQRGRQWLELPLEGGGVGASALDVRLGLSGAPDRERGYLVVYHSTNHDGYLVGLTEDPSAPAPVTTCARA